MLRPWGSGTLTPRKTPNPSMALSGSKESRMTSVSWKSGAGSRPRHDFFLFRLRLVMIFFLGHFCRRVFSCIIISPCKKKWDGNDGQRGVHRLFVNIAGCNFHPVRPVQWCDDLTSRKLVVLLEKSPAHLIVVPLVPRYVTYVWSPGCLYFALLGGAGGGSDLYVTSLEGYCNKNTIKCFGHLCRDKKQQIHLWVNHLGCKQNSWKN